MPTSEWAVYRIVVLLNAAEPIHVTKACITIDKVVLTESSENSRRVRTAVFIFEIITVDKFLILLDDFISVACFEHAMILLLGANWINRLTTKRLVRAREYGAKLASLWLVEFLCNSKSTHIAQTRKTVDEVRSNKFSVSFLIIRVTVTVVQIIFL